MSQPPEPDNAPDDAPDEASPAGPDPADERKTLRRVRLFGLIQSAVSTLLGLMLVSGRILAPAAALPMLQACFLLLVLPSFICAVALLIYHALKTGRETASWTGEVAFWSVPPITAAILLWAF